MTETNRFIKGALRQPHAVLFGAGVSRNSGVPLTVDFQRHLFDSIGTPTGAADRILAARMPFEAFVQVVLDGLGTSDILNVFDGGVPNRTHQFLAGMARDGMCRAALTTNFDRLFEDALSRTCPFNRYYTEAELASVEWENTFPIIKIHGDVQDLNSLAATIRTVGSAKLVRQRRLVIHELFERDDIQAVIVLGYSCSDVFDLRPAVFSVANRRTSIVYIEHVDIPWADASVVRLDETEAGRFFRGFDGVGIRCNTDDLVEFGWRMLFGEAAPPLAVSSYQWKEHIDRSLREAMRDYGTGFGHYMTGKLLQAAGEYRESNRSLRRGHRTLRGPKMRGAARQTYGDNHRDIDAGAKAPLRSGDMTRRRRVALCALREAASSAGSTETLAYARAVMSMGVVFADHAEAAGSKSHLRKALRCYKRATAVARHVGNDELAGIGYGNMGIVLKNLNKYDQAILMQRRAITVARKTGDLRSLARGWGNLGVAQSDAGDSGQAIASYRRARPVSAALGDARHVGIWDYNMGFDYEKLGDADSAAKSYQRARRMFSELRLHPYIAKCDDRLSALGYPTAT